MRSLLREPRADADRNRPTMRASAKATGEHRGVVWSGGELNPVENQKNERALPGERVISTGRLQSDPGDMPAASLLAAVINKKRAARSHQSKLMLIAPSRRANDASRAFKDRIRGSLDNQRSA